MNSNNLEYRKKPIFIGKRNRKIPSAILINERNESSNQFQNVSREDTEIKFGPSQQKFKIFRNVGAEKKFEPIGSQTQGAGTCYQSSSLSTLESNSFNYGRPRESNSFQPPLRSMSGGSYSNSTRNNYSLHGSRISNERNQDQSFGSLYKQDENNAFSAFGSAGNSYQTIKTTNQDGGVRNKFPGNASAGSYSTPHEGVSFGNHAAESGGFSTSALDNYLRLDQASSNTTFENYSKLGALNPNLPFGKSSSGVASTNLTLENRSRLVEPTSSFTSRSYSRQIEPTCSFTSGSYSRQIERSPDPTPSERRERNFNKDFDTFSGVFKRNASFTPVSYSEESKESRRAEHFDNHSKSEKTHFNHSQLGNDGHFQDFLKTEPRESEPNNEDKRVIARFEIGSIVKVVTLPVNIFNAASYLKMKLASVGKTDRTLSKLNYDSLILQQYNPMFDEFVDIDRDIQVKEGETIKVVPFSSEFSFEERVPSLSDNDRETMHRNMQSPRSENQRYEGKTLKGDAGFTPKNISEDVVDKGELTAESLARAFQEHLKNSSDIDTDELAEKVLRKLGKGNLPLPSSSSQNEPQSFTQKMAHEYGSNNRDTIAGKQLSQRGDRAMENVRQDDASNRRWSGSLDSRASRFSRNTSRDTKDSYYDRSCDGASRNTQRGSSAQSTSGIQNFLDASENETLCPGLLIEKVNKEFTKPTTKEVVRERQEQQLSAGKTRDLKAISNVQTNATRKRKAEYDGKISVLPGNLSSKNSGGPRPNKDRADPLIKNRNEDELMEQDTLNMVAGVAKRERGVNLEEDGEGSKVFWKKMMKLESKAAFYNPGRNKDYEKYMSYAMKLHDDPMDILSQKRLPFPTTFNQYSKKLGNMTYYYFNVYSQVLSDREFPCYWASMIIEQAKRYAAIHTLYALQSMFGSGDLEEPHKTDDPLTKTKTSLKQRNPPLIKEQLPSKKAFFVWNVIGEKRYTQLELDLKRGLSIDDARKLHNISRKMTIAVYKKLFRKTSD